MATSPPRIAWIALGVVFAAFSLWIHFQVKVQPAASQQTTTQIGSLRVGDTAPDFSALDLTDHRIDLAAYRGDRIVVLDFWATWCGPCVMAMPGLQKIHEEYSSRGVEVLAVNQGEERQRITRFIQRQNYTFRVLRDEGSTVGHLFGIQALPAQLIIGTDGRIAWMRLGYSPDGEEVLRRQLDRLTRSSGA